MRETDIIPKGIVKRQKSTFEPLASSLKRQDSSSRAGELVIRRAFTETKTIRAKVGGDLREVLITVMRDSLPASAVRKKPPDIEIPLERLKICSEKTTTHHHRILLLDTYSETSTEVPQTPKYAYTDNEDESEADTAASTSRTTGSTIIYSDLGRATALERREARSQQLSWPEVFLLLATYWCCLQVAQSLVGY